MNDNSSLGEKLFSGAIAGIVGTTVIFPIDSIKTRLQSGRYGSINGFRCCSLVYKSEGIFGFYRGLGANILGVTPEKAIKLAVNDYMRSMLSLKIGSTESNLPALYGMLAGATAGFCQVVATNPMEIVKIQLQLQQASNSTGIANVLRQLGLRGIYKGTTATLCRDIPFSMMFFQTFAYVKALLVKNTTDGNLLASLTAGMISGAISAFLATPMDVVKTRLQSPENLKAQVKMADIYKQIWAVEGISGFFRGGLQRSMIVAPLFAISLMVYDLQHHLFRQGKK